MMSRMDKTGIGMTSERTRKRLIERLKATNVIEQVVLNKMSQVPRHLFVDEALAHRAYEDIPLPIGYGQTISQPYIVARMTSALLNETPLERVLEIGTGSGYQTAILAELSKTVYTIERIGALQQQARKRLTKLNYQNIYFKHGDGQLGWAAHAPYTGIIVTAAPETVPEALLEQLAVGGHMVIPLGEDTQDLQLITRTATGYTRVVLDRVRFVPLVDGKL